jgi:hypothetical protein
MSLQGHNIVVKLIFCEILSSHGSKYEAQNLLGCTAMFLTECRLTFQRYVLPDTLMMVAARTSETSVDIQLRTWQSMPEDSELQTYILTCR